MVVIQTPFGAPATRAAMIDCTSAIDAAFSSGVWYPGRLPIATM